MRLVIVSNRLPITAEESSGGLIFKPSAGGLATGIKTYIEHLGEKRGRFSDRIWVGWPGIDIPERSRKNFKRSLLSQFNCHPVFLSDIEVDKFYNGFCNDTIWPLFHYFPAHVSYVEEYWTYYKKANEIFQKGLLEILRADDLLWIHDYHLMLLPALIRQKMPSIPIGFFLHIPFPSFEIFRLLPSVWRKAILEGLMGADLVGFHTHDYTQYFLRCVLRILSLDHDLGKIQANHRIAKAYTFPMGIDYQKFHNSSDVPEIRSTIEGYRKEFGETKVILSMDRLDYTKGIINRLKAFQMFLEKYTEWHGKVTFICQVVPSRTGVELYQKMRSQIEETVSTINGKFGTMTWTPIMYLFKSLPFNDIAALYNISDVALVTPLRDGMNLIAKEYISSRKDKTGVMILSEMAGAARELGEAIHINPFYVEEIVNALKEALELPKFEQIKRNHSMQTRLERYNVVRWAEDFIGELLSFKEEQKNFDLKYLSPPVLKKLEKDFETAESRLLFLDYDGTLVPFAELPENAKPGEELIEILKKLSSIPSTEVVVISGREKKTLENWLGGLDISLVAEHGAWIREKGQKWQTTKPLTSDWKPQILPLLELYTDRLPGSFVEHKEFSLVWHYRNADPEISVVRVRELVDNLMDLTAHNELQVVEGNKVVEVKNSGINKGISIGHFMSKKPYQFVLAAGDDRTDEDLFRALPENVYSIKVGLTESFARYNLGDHSEVRKLLLRLIKIS